VSELPYPNQHPEPTVTFTFRELFERLEHKLDKIDQNVSGRLADVEIRMNKVENNLPIADGTRRVEILEGYIPKMDDRLTKVEAVLIEDKGGRVARADLWKFLLGTAAIAGSAAAYIKF
jgi:hypothetical protein